MSRSTGRTRVLYLYDVEGWAIHNVGLHWASLVEEQYDFTFMAAEAFSRALQRHYDIIWWGYSALIKRNLRSRIARKVTPRFLIPLFKPARQITIVHDPCELFPQVPHWKECDPKSDFLRWFDHIGVASSEMQGLLADAGLHSAKINTASTLPTRSRDELVREPLRGFSRAADYPRKNIPLFLRLAEQWRHRQVELDGYFDSTILPTPAYLQLIDRHNCYLCTSWQEGGPIPLMDAIQRGCVVLTTRVGQTDELVREGYNGYFCDSQEAFSERIADLSANQDRLLEMRHHALEVAQSKDAVIRQQLLSFLGGHSD